MNHKDLVDNLLTKFNGVQLGKATLFNCDCMELMAHIPDKAIALAIVDPPYGIDVAKSGKVGGSVLAKTKDYGAKDWDENAPNQDYFNQLIRVGKNQIIWGANHFADRLPCPKSPCWIVWDKINGENNFADSELAYTSFKSAVRNFRYQWARMLQGDMKNKEQRIHPTQKPVKLYEWLLTNYAKQGDNILDTHLGSMSSVIACNNLGFDIIGCELDKDYFNAGIERVRKAMMQESLFAPAPVVKIEQDKLFD